MKLAQVNVAEAVARLDSPRLRGFVSLLTPLDTLARRAPGFVWRPGPDEIDPAELAVFGDPGRVVVNLSVWESLDALLAFTCSGRHRTAVRHRGRWFVRPDRPAVALWWVPDGHRPSFAEAHDRSATSASTARPLPRSPCRRRTGRRLSRRRRTRASPRPPARTAR